MARAKACLPLGQKLRSEGPLRSARQRLRRDLRGVAAVEFALVGVVFLLTVFAVVEFGLFEADQLGLSRGLEAALRYGVVNGATACGSSGALALAAPFAQQAGALITAPLPPLSVSCSPAGASAPGTKLTVSASLSFDPLVFPTDFSSLTVAGSVTGILVH